MDYCLDTSFLIEAKNTFLSFELAPGFWVWLDKQYRRGAIYSSMLVCDELEQGNDELARWAKAKRHSGMFKQPGTATQEAMKEVAAYVSDGRYEERYVHEFLSKADPWVIAQAKVDKACVVTMEKEVERGSKKIKIPNVSKALDVKVVSAFKMLRDLGLSLR